MLIKGPKIMEILLTSFVLGTQTIHIGKNMGSVTTGEEVGRQRVKLRLEWRPERSQKNGFESAMA
jgi:hypothetical protein